MKPYLQQCKDQALRPHAAAAPPDRWLSIGLGNWPDPDDSNLHLSVHLDGEPCTPPYPSQEKSPFVWRQELDYGDGSSSEVGTDKIISAPHLPRCPNGLLRMPDHDEDWPHVHNRSEEDARAMLEEGARLLVEFRESLSSKNRLSEEQSESVASHDEGRRETGKEETLERAASKEDVNNMNPLLRVLHRVLSEETSAGLTAAELGAKLMEESNKEELEGSAIPRSVKLARIMKGSPYFAELDNGRFTLWTKILAQGSKSSQNVQKTKGSKPSVAIAAQVKVNKHADKKHQMGEGPVARKEKKGENLAKKAKRDRPEDKGMDLSSSMQCKRRDGKGWQCREKARVGYCWCDYHLTKHRQNHQVAKMRKLRKAPP